ncbi:hypothetical protein PsYK624_121230 [Phanerochaete sordida]|uniref:BTB domain-containing protein n=1 Tax=Phanerochaete sordida TaxID=48140 RepID=A0A9P3GJ53_9APHY|nr:hypothetical protein PsYK624_121230 [Phanerochaete sordida]
MQVDTTNDAVRHPTLYKASGDLVVSAADGSATHLFRVHALILAEQSPVFAGMLSLPTTGGADMQTYDGAPIVHLPDNAKDVTALLEAIYTPGYPILKNARTFASDVYGLMSIATKYEVDSICVAISARLKEQWPATRTDFMLAREDRHRYAVGPFFCGGPRSPEPASAIRLATDFNIPEVLAAAYYELATHDIIEGDLWARDSSSPRWDLLRPEELLRYYQGKHRLAKEFFEAVDVFDSVYDSDVECETVFDDFEDDGEFTDSSACRKALAKARYEWDRAPPSLSVVRFRLTDADPMHTLLKIYEGESKPGKLCTPCAGAFQSHCVKTMEALWDALPAIFSLKDHPFYTPVPRARRGQH